jgi:flagellar export protein FliJ
VAKFKFRLESLKTFRDQKLQAAKKELAILLEQHRSVLQNHRRCFEQQRIALEEREASLMSGALVQDDPVASLRLKESRLRSELSRLESEIERHQKWLTHLGRELKVVEKLEEKQRAEFESKQLLKEKRRMDSWVAERWKADEEAS